MMDNGNGFRNDHYSSEAPGTRIPSPIFPPGAALGMTWDVNLARAHGDLLGRWETVWRSVWMGAVCSAGENEH